MQDIRVDIVDIQEKLQDNVYKNEEHIRLSLVCRLLLTLGWDIWNPREVNTEFSAIPMEDKTRVDIALFAKGSTPSVFIETKTLGKLATGLSLSEVERQVRDYNRNNTALFSIITDGRIWRFYFSQTGGEFHEKCFKECDLLNDDLETLEETFLLFLEKNRILNGDAENEARKHLDLKTLKKTIQESLPQARRMTEVPPFPRFPQALAEVVRRKGFDVSEAQIAELLERPFQPQFWVTTTPEKAIKLLPVNSLKQMSPKRRSRSVDSFIFAFKGKQYQAGSARDVMVQVFRLLAHEDPKFLDQFAAQKHGKKRRYIAKEKKDLYPNKPDLVEKESIEFFPGWWIGTNYNRETIQKILDLAMEVLDPELQSTLEVSVLSPLNTLSSTVLKKSSPSRCSGHKRFVKS
ncbi:MAG: hypothetical protein ACK5CA_08635 [Cyanobacteriota bacterium]|jgi:predicted type IV restriction endonuclease